jgi:hypothetical protein
MWGSGNWSEMVWGGGGQVIPALDAVGLAIVVCSLVAGGVAFGRKRRAPGDRSDCIEASRGLENE